MYPIHILCNNIQFLHGIIILMIYSIYTHAVIKKENVAMRLQRCASHNYFISISCPSLKTRDSCFKSLTTGMNDLTRPMDVASYERNRSSELLYYLLFFFENDFYENQSI